MLVGKRGAALLLPAGSENPVSPSVFLSIGGSEGSSLVLGGVGVSGTGRPDGWPGRRVKISDLLPPEFVSSALCL